MAPNMKVKMNTIATAPYPADLFVSASLESPPARNRAIPCPTDPQYNVHRRPIRSSVKTQINVENM